MAILTGNTTEIKVQPSGLTPTYNETIIVLESPNIQSDNFKWLVDIWIDGLPNAVGSTKISSLTILPNPDGFGVIDVHRHIENHITSTFNLGDKDTLNLAQESYRYWSIDVTEIFENPVWRFDDNNFYAGKVGFTTDQTISSSYSNDKHPFITGDEVVIQQDPGFTHSSYNTGTTLTYEDEYSVSTTIPWAGSTPVEGGIMTLVSGGTRTIYQEDIATNLYRSFNGVIDYVDFPSWSSDPYDINATAYTGNFLTNITTGVTLDIDSRMWLNGWSDSGLYNNIVVNSNNGQYQILTTFTGETTENKQIVQAKLGPKDLLETTSNINVLAGTLPIIDDNTTYISFVATNNFFPVSVGMEFQVIDKCSKYEKVQFLFLDRLGSFIPLTFNMVSKTNVDNKRSNYYQNYGTYDSISNSWGYTSYDRGTTTYDIVSTKRFTATSDWLSEEEANLVHIMLRSPEVYYTDETGTMRAITITTNTYEEKKRENDKLINYTVSFELSQKDRNQKG